MGGMCLIEGGEQAERRGSLGEPSPSLGQGFADFKGHPERPGTQPVWLLPMHLIHIAALEYR